MSSSGACHPLHALPRVPAHGPSQPYRIPTYSDRTESHLRQHMKTGAKRHIVDIINYLCFEKNIYECENNDCLDLNANFIKTSIDFCMMK